MKTKRAIDILQKYQIHGNDFLTADYTQEELNEAMLIAIDSLQSKFVETLEEVKFQINDRVELIEERRNDCFNQFSVDSKLEIISIDIEDEILPYFCIDEKGIKSWLSGHMIRKSKQ